MALVMGTAGHIDHGKTSLIRALTGINCDRLHEEQKRGITIELGFAFFDLPEKNGKQARMGIVDVPGHERFVRNMVAGATGIDFVLLVIAADEGVMPQTREHLEICSILNIQHGIIALTKVDMVDDELLELAKEDVLDFVKGSFLENAPIFPVSSQTNQGIDELKKEIFDQNEKLIPKRRNDLFRLPVDRVFTLKGHGTLITGTLLSGSAKVGDEIEVIPTGHTSRIRSIQNHGQSIEKAEAGHRISMNLTGLEVSDISRGDIISMPNNLFTSKKWIISLTCLSSSPRALRHRREIHFHHAAKDVMARLYLYDREKINPGETALCEVRFSEPLAGVFADKCVIRAFSPLQTVAGGTIIIPLEDTPKRSQITQEWQAKLLKLPKDFSEKDAHEAVFTQIYFGHPYGIEQRKLAVLTNLDEKQLEKATQNLTAKQRISIYDKEKKILIASEYVNELCQEFIRTVTQYHTSEPLKSYMPKAALIAPQKSLKLAHFILERLIKQNELIAEEDGVRLKNHSISLKTTESDLKNLIEKAFKENLQTPPLLKELLLQNNCTQKELLPVLQLLIQEKKITKIIDGMYFNTDFINNIQKNLVSFFAQNKEMTPTDFKVVSQGLTRKYSIPLLEYFDKERITIRVGDARQLRNISLLNTHT